MAPPWDSGDLNLARSLVLGDTRVAMTFLGDDADPTPWPAHHRRLALDFGADPPGRLEKWQIASHLVQHPPAVDLVHALLSPPPAGYAQRVMLRLPSLRRRPLLLTCPTTASPPLTAIRRSAAVAAMTHRAAQAVRALGHPLVRHIAPATDLRRLRPGPAGAARDSLEIEDVPHLLFVGDHAPEGGLLEALRTAAEVRRRAPAVRVLLRLRRPADRNPALVSARLREMVLGLGLGGRVTILSGRASLLAAAQASSAILYQPEAGSGPIEIPPLLVDALALGRPLVLSDREPLDDLGDGGPAVVFGGGAEAAVAAHLARICTDSGYAEECGQAARSLAEARHDEVAAVAAYRALYEEISSR